jgi:hypothetical protein
MIPAQGRASRGFGKIMRDAKTSMNEVVVLTGAFSKPLKTYCVALASPRLPWWTSRALDVSHGGVYRHFPSKASLRQAVTSAGSTAPPLGDRGAATVLRRRGWKSGSAPCSRSSTKICEDPEIFKPI